MSHAIRTMLAAAALALLSAAVLIAVAHPAHAAGSADVRFVEPERFSDAGRGALERERALEVLAAHLQELSRRLPDGQRLKVEVLDVDLAGELRWRGGQEVRVLRGGADAPHIQLRWSLEQGGAALKSGQDRLTDLGYLQGRAWTSGQGDGLPYERRMLAQWFRVQFEGGR